MSYTWYTKGSGLDFDSHENYVNYTDNIHSLTGVAFNCGTPKVTKNIDNLTDFYIGFTVYYAGKNPGPYNGAWNWLEVTGNGTDFIKGSDSYLCCMPDSNGYKPPYKKGLSHIIVHVDTVNDKIEYWHNLQKVYTRESAGIAGKSYTAINMSPTGGGANYAQRDNAISDLIITTEKTELDKYISKFFQSVSITFDGSTNYAEIPVSLTDVSDWSAEITFTTTENRADSRVYHQPCIFGYDSRSYLSRDFHVDTSGGNLYVFNGLGNSSAPVGGTASQDNGDYGINTGIKVNDGKKHTVKAISTTGKIEVYCDGTLATTVYPTTTLSADAFYIGCSKPSESVFGQLTLYSFSLTKSVTLVASYQPTVVNDALTNILTDNSGNGNNATLYGNTYTYTAITEDIDFSLSADTSRVVQTITTVKADTNRAIAVHIEDFTLSADTSRAAYRTEIIKTDTSRAAQAATTINADAARKTVLPFEIDADTNRMIAVHLIDFNFLADTGRKVQRAEFVTNDTARKVEKIVAVNSDAVRETQAAFEINTDTSRKVKAHVVSRCCTVRNVKFCVEMYLMTSRNVTGKVTVRVPTCVYRAVVINVGGDGGSYIKPKKNLVIDANGNETAPTYLDADTHTPQVVGVNDFGRIVSIKIESTTNNMTDTVTIETVNMKFMVDDRLSGTILDYDLSGFKVQSVTQTGYTTTIVATQDWCLFGRAIIYYGTSPTNLPLKKSNSNESGHRPLVTFNKMEEETTYKSPQEKEKLSSALSKLGAQYNGEDYGITTDLNGKSGTIVDMVSSLISWSKAIPTKAINAHIENGIIKCVQRGREEVFTDISMLKHPVETYKEERYSEWSIMSYVDKFESSPSKSGVTKEHEIEGDPWAVAMGGYSGIVEGGISLVGSSISRTKSGSPAKITNTMSDGSTETINYSYYGDDRIYGVYEDHVYESADKKDVTNWGISHQDIGAPDSFTMRYNDDGSAESILTTENFNSGFLGRGGTGHKIVISTHEKTWSEDGSVLYHIKRVDNFGNAATYDSYSPEDSYPFPLEKDDCLSLLKEIGRCRKVITLNIDIVSPVDNGRPQYTHIITHREKVSYKGQEYFLESNTVTITPNAFTQSLTLKRYVQ